MLSASCHCGAVQIEVARRPRSLTQCTCSVCRRYGALWAYCSPRTARVAAEPGALSGYAWNGRTLTFFHCSRCGCLTHYESNERAEGERTIAVNARMFAAETIAGIRVRTFDGADTWKYVDEPAGAWKLPGPPARPAPAGRRSRR